MAKLKGIKPEKICATLDKFISKRVNHDHIWQEVADYILPLQNDIQTVSSPGEQKYNDLFDSTAPTSLELLAGTLHSMLTSPTSFFFGLSTGSPELDQEDAVRQWLQGETRAMHETLNNSNFQTEVHMMYLNLLGFGNCVQAMEEDDDTVVRFTTRAVREGYWGEDSKGRINEFRRPYKATATELVDDFGYENVGEKVQQAYDKGRGESFDVIHAIYPAPKDKGKSTSRFKYVSQYVLVCEKLELKLEGFYEFPYLIPRWLKIAGDSYGRGCGEKALPETKTVNLMQEVTLKGAQKTIDPPLQAPDNGFVMPLLTRPASINYYRKGSQDRIEPIFNDARIDFGYQAIDRTQAKIREAFYIDQLRLRDGPQMTATEVNERTEQALRFMGPMLGRLRTEYLDPMVTRLYRIRERRGLVAPLPEQLRGVPLQIHFTSVMAMAQRQSELTNIRRTFAEITPLAQAQPEVLQNFNGDRSFRYIARLCQLPQEMMNTTEELAQLREMLQQQQQAMQAQAAQAAEADAASKLVNASAKVMQSA